MAGSVPKSWCSRSRSLTGCDLPGGARWSGDERDRCPTWSATGHPL
ncbi:hypothetical protein [Ornithinimicrobium kibberense]